MKTMVSRLKEFVGDATRQAKSMSARPHLGQVPVGSPTSQRLIHNDGALWLHMGNDCTHASRCQLACIAANTSLLPMSSSSIHRVRAQARADM